MVCRLLFIALLLVPVARAVGPVALADGERLSFRVSWGIFGNAGQITVSAEDEVLEGLPQTRVVTETSTRGVVRRLYPFEGRVESVFDYDSGRLLAARARTSAGRRHTHASIVFNYLNGEATYVDMLRPERNTRVAIPPTFTMDLITSLINARSWNIQPGESRDVAVLFDDEFYELVVTAEGVQTIATPEGPQEALLLVPRMEGEQKGMFRRGGEVRVWLSWDEERLPLRLEVAMPVGTATAVLTEYRPPRTARTTQAHANTGF
jgi:hypothetical protein